MKQNLSLSAKELAKAFNLGRAFSLGIDFANGSSSFANDAKWITVHPNGAKAKGRPVLVSENGEILAGMGGKFDGLNIKDIKDQKRQSSLFGENDGHKENVAGIKSHNQETRNARILESIKRDHADLVEKLRNNKIGSEAWEDVERLEKQRDRREKLDSSYKLERYAQELFRSKAKDLPTSEEYQSILNKTATLEQCKDILHRCEKNRKILMDLIPRPALRKSVSLTRHFDKLVDIGFAANALAEEKKKSRSKKKKKTK